VLKLSYQRSKLKEFPGFSGKAKVKRTMTNGRCESSAFLDNSDTKMFIKYQYLIYLLVTGEAK
jgi:hypothetical protein